MVYVLCLSPDDDTWEREKYVATYGVMKNKLSYMVNVHIVY